MPALARAAVTRAVCSTSKTTRLLDEPRPGGPRSISDEQIEQVLVATLERTPKDATHWSRASMAAEAAASRSTVGRIWRASSAAVGASTFTQMALNGDKAQRQTAN